MDEGIPKNFVEVYNFIVFHSNPFAGYEFGHGVLILKMSFPGEHPVSVYHPVCGY